MFNLHQVNKVFAVTSIRNIFPGLLDILCARDAVLPVTRVFVKRKTVTYVRTAWKK